MPDEKDTPEEYQEEKLMKKETNILLTSLSSQYDRKTHRYFYYTENGETHYCDGLSVAEAGAKYLLSRVPIDEIIVLGTGRTYDKGQEMKPLVLNEWSDFDSQDTSSLSEYSFFQYRIAQFLDGLDLEAVDVLEDTTDIDVDSVNENFQNFLNEIRERDDYRPDRLFHLIAQHDELYAKFIEHFDESDKKEILWLMRKIYTDLSDSMKLSPRQDNSGLQICFIPTEKNRTRDYVPAENVSQLVHVLNSIEADVVNVYMDMQGLASTEGYTFLAVLSMLSQDVNNHLRIQEIITSRYDRQHFANPIDNNEMKRYDINVLISGMSAFVRYGKVDDVLAYWNSRNIQNDHIDQLLYAMRRVDEGISLCNIQDLEAGITLLKKVFENTATEDLPEVESNIFRILEQTIRMDYGALLEGDSINQMELIKWSFRKNFYQQTLTIIESKIPIEIVKNGLFFYATDESSQNAFLEESNKQYWDAAPKDRWQFDHMPHFFVKNFAKGLMKRSPGTKDRARDFVLFRMEALDEGNSDLPRCFTRLGDRKLLEEVLYSYTILGTIRNHVNHAQDAAPIDISTIDIHMENPNLLLIKNGVNNLINTFEKAMKYLEEHPSDLPVVEFPDHEFRDYCNAHKIFKTDKPRKDFIPRKDEEEKKPAETPQPAAETKPEAAAAPVQATADSPVPEAPAKPASDPAPAPAASSPAAPAPGGSESAPKPQGNKPKDQKFFHNNFNRHFDSRNPDEKRSFKPNKYQGNHDGYHGNNNGNHGGFSNIRQQVINIATGKGNLGGKLLRITINIEEEGSGNKNYDD